MNLCQCGCGEEVKIGNRYIWRHSATKGKKSSEETKRKISLNNKARLPEVRAKQSMSLKKFYENNPGIRDGVNNPFFGRTHSDDAKKRIANFNTTQREFSEETRKKIREKRGGENSNFWNGGINLDSYHYPDDSKEIKENTLIRDKYTCQECGRVWNRKERRFTLHHIDYSRTNHHMWNRITLCLYCHAATNQNRPYWQQKFSFLILAKYNRLFL